MKVSGSWKSLSGHWHSMRGGVDELALPQNEWVLVPVDNSEVIPNSVHQRNTMRGATADPFTAVGMTFSFVAMLFLAVCY